MKEAIKRRYVSLTELMQYTGLGKNSVYDLAARSGSRVKLNRRVLYDLEKVNAYLDAQTRQQAACGETAVKE